MDKNKNNNQRVAVNNEATPSVKDENPRIEIQKRIENTAANDEAKRVSAINAKKDELNDKINELQHVLDTEKVMSDAQRQIIADKIALLKKERSNLKEIKVRSVKVKAPKVSSRRERNRYSIKDGQAFI